MSNIYFETVRVDFKSGMSYGSKVVSGQVSLTFPSNVISAIANIKELSLWNTGMGDLITFKVNIKDINWIGNRVSLMFYLDILCFNEAFQTSNFFDPDSSYSNIAVVAECE